MKISVLVENSVCSSGPQGIKPEHGLSIHIELGKTKVLFDIGQSDLFIRNAKKMGIDLSDVDYLVISHGHVDHGGGLRHFLEINEKAKIFLHRKALHRYYAKIFGLFPYYIGLDQNVLNKQIGRFHFIEDVEWIDENLLILEKFPHDFPLPKGNLSLFEKDGKRFIHDQFQHEILLIVKEEDEYVILTGCSHSGIINMVNKSKEYVEMEKVKAVMGGFHTFNPISRKNEDPDYISRLGSALQKSNLTYFTGHCTGGKNYQYLKSKLGDKIGLMNTGNVFKF